MGMWGGLLGGILEAILFGFWEASWRIPVLILDKISVSILGWILEGILLLLPLTFTQNHPSDAKQPNIVNPALAKMFKSQ